MTKTLCSFTLRVGLVMCALGFFLAKPLHAQEVQKPPVVALDEATVNRLVGLWRGRLKIDDKTGFTLALQIERKADGALQAWMHSLDQNALDLRIEKISAQNDKISFDVPQVSGKFEGVLQGEGGEDRRLAGTWTQGIALPVDMHPVASIPEIARPQEPTKPYPYRDEEITFANGDVKLNGTLTLPAVEGDKKFPAVVFVQDGSPGQHPNRDARQFAHRPFLILADWLTRQGFATLRFDPRPSATAEVSAPYADRVGDLASALKFLRDRPEIDAKRAGLLSMGEGSNVAGRVAADDPTVAFVVLMSPVGLRGSELLILQATAVPEIKDRAAAQVEVLTKIIDIMETEDDATQRMAMVRQTVQSELQKAFFPGARELKPEQQKVLDDMVNNQVKVIGSPWFREFLSHDPREALARIKAPVLALSGQFNTLIPGRQNLSAIREALQKGGNKDFTVQELPGLNYLFQTSETGKMEDFVKVKETISPKVLEMLNEWLQKRTAAP